MSKKKGEWVYTRGRQQANAKARRYHEFYVKVGKQYSEKHGLKPK